MKRTEKNSLQMEIFGALKSREAVLTLLHSDPQLNQEFLSLNNRDFQDNLVEFMMGERMPKVSYDPVFKYLFNPEIHPERLSNLLSALMGERVAVKRGIPVESGRLSEQGSLLIMDILVELQSGELANVEMQRIGYAFPGQRGACYSSDLLMRQYSRVKSTEGSRFSYRKLERVYSIILLEQSTFEFHALPNAWIHRSQQTFDTGLQLELLQKFIFVSLDIFHQNVHNISNELDAWLHFLSSDDPRIIRLVVDAYPKFQELCDDLAKFRTDPKELITMYSEALSILDYNTVQYMIDEQRKEIEAQRKKLAEKDSAIAKKDSAIAEKDSAIAEKDSAIAEKNSAIAEKDSTIAEKDSAIAEKERENELLRRQLQRKNDN